MIDMIIITIIILTYITIIMINGSDIKIHPFPVGPDTYGYYKKI